MNPRELPPDWDWVKARHECSAAKFFERLHLLTIKNIEDRNALVKDLQRVEAVEAYPSLFSVIRRLHPDHAVVRFRLTSEDKIRVDGTGPLVSDLKFEGTVVLTDEGECRLSVGDDSLSEWQVLLRALQGLFFAKDP